MGSFHGYWSLAGFAGALLALMVLSFQLNPLHHFLIVLVFILVLISFNYRYLVKTTVEKVEKKPQVSLRLCMIYILAYPAKASLILFNASFKISSLVA